jgi:repressor of nif and glnA expression|tara:strand:- start:755 stop:1120 length:366 start_codon:yes stop_codon:yes gene_type:complete
MEHSNKDEGIATSKKKVVNNTIPIRVKKTTSRTIRTILNKLNKKQLGKKATVDDVISKALPLLTDKHLDEIKEATYSSKDRLEMQYQDYCRKHGNISKETFLEMLLQAGLPVLTSTSQSDD